MMVRSTLGGVNDPVQSGLGKLAPRRLWNGLKALFGVRPSEVTFRESIEELIEEHHDDGLPGEVEERTMFRNLLDFGRLDVADVMVPRADIVSIPAACLNVIPFFSTLLRISTANPRQTFRSHPFT